MSGIFSTTYGVVNGVVLRLAFAGEMLLFYLVIETIIPKSRNSFASTVRSALYTATSMTINILLFSILLEYFDKDRLHGFFLLDLTPLTDSPHLPIRIIGWITAALAASLIGNVFYYWLHRAQHAVPLLWRFHRVHHSITEMSAVSSYHHFRSEERRVGKECRSR